MQKLVTHNGAFHCDEVLAFVILKKIYPDYNLIRARDPKEIQKGGIIFDVGGQYSLSKDIYDHHFNNAPTRPTGEKYSSAGLIWKHFGMDYLNQITTPTEKLWEQIDDRIFRWVDIVDNGEIKQLPKNCITINHMVNSFIPNWNSDESFDGAFHKVANWLQIWFEKELDKFIGQIKAEQKVLDDYHNREYANFLIMEEFRPWQKALFDNEIADEIDYVIYYDKNNDDYKIQCVPPYEGSFEKKKPLPKKWAGLRGQELSDLVGVEMVFCHPGQFIGGFKYKKDIPYIIQKLNEEDIWQ